MSANSNINDTSRHAELVLIDLTRKKQPGDRVAEAIAASNLVAAQCKNAIRRRYPELSEEEVGLRFIDLNYGCEIANEVRAWLRQGGNE